MELNRRLYRANNLFIPNTLNRAGESSALQNSTSDSSNAAGTNALDTPSNIDAQGFLAVLEGSTAQLPTADGGSWSSSDTSIAEVDSSGIVTGVQQGRCQITDGKTAYQIAVRQLEQRQEGTYVDGILIVNKSYPLSADYDPGLQPITKDAFQKLSDAAAQEGLDLYIGSDYRDYAYQVKIYNNYCEIYGSEQADSFSARPGYSEHQTGLTIDCNTIDDAFGETAEAVWLAEHCADYGFIIRFPDGKENITGYQYEPWHIRYVGVDTAKEIMSQGLTLEEYLGVQSEYAGPWEG